MNHIVKNLREKETNPLIKKWFLILGMCRWLVQEATQETKYQMTKSTRRIQWHAGVLISNCLKGKSWISTRYSTLCILAEEKRHLPLSMCRGNPPPLMETVLQEESNQPCWWGERRAIAPIAQISMCKSISGSESFTLQMIKNRAAKDKELSCQQTKIHKDSVLNIQVRI